MKTSDANLSVWQATASLPPFAPMTRNQAADVCVVGAGIAGISTAYELARAGKSVIVLDSSSVGGGMTARTTAHLVSALDDRYFELEQLHGEEGARIAAESHSAAIGRIETIVREENIDCDFSRLDGFLFNPPGESEEVLTREYEAGVRAGLALEKVARAPMDFETGLALRFPNQAQFHPLKYLQALAEALVRAGGKIFTGSKVTSVAGGEGAHVETAAGYRVEAESVVVATNSPINDRYLIHTKQAPYLTYVLALEVPRGAAPHALFWDTAQEAGMQGSSGPIPYHYVRLESGAENDLLIVGGEDHKTGQASDFEERFLRLEKWTRERFPVAGEIVYRWSGQVMEPIDGMGYIGRNPLDAGNVFIATGDSGNGMTHGVIAGLLISDLIQGRENPWSKLYDPSRKSLRSALDFAHENLNVAAQFRDYVTGGDLAAFEEIGAGEGAILRDGLSKIAAYRDDAGALHKFSAVCPHLKCIVRWNGTEKTWDCPCHGSRFDALGKVTMGPAVSDLPAVE